ncbi:prepilin-type N-terminal cleavage/methylation domain-containing protein [Francisella sp. LA112445]|uniref:prepilin-type N-terminal cleavage/methylation domain-containing protein n=1 Tax=Francisella sp. LA112445 TaxID=1395624 RepID=UPI001788B5EE|nr:prepilin-type N-terminal cleavage/methylation domain-containing protein [Francisella sp. LA112445]QIW10465.1 prepilin-type N-terminal cleavage/methylation domain-containing protein [Francisella sp. LA112445]
MIRNNKGFSLVELMVVIAIVAILVAAAVVSYSNHITKVRLQDEIDKMDNYRKAVAIYIQEQGISSDEQFQSGIADMKDNYFGDDNVAIMNEFRENNGRLISHPIVQGIAYQIAITPRINNGGTLVNWECDIGYDNRSDGTVNSNQPTGSPPSGAMPNGCNETSEELNDDLLEFQSLLDELSSTVDTNFNNALNAWYQRRDDALEVDTEYQNYITARDSALADYNNYQNEIATINGEIATRNDLIDQKDTDATQYEAEAAVHRANQATAEANGNTELVATFQASAEAAEANATTLRNEISVLEDEVTLLGNNKTIAQTNSTNSYNDYNTQASNAETRYAAVEADTKNLEIPEGTPREEIENYSYSQAIILSNQEYNAAKDALLEDPQFADTVRDSADRLENGVPVGAPEV